jgi:hypothetical protein
LGITVNDVHRIAAQTGQRAPFFLRKIDRAGDVAFLEIFGFAHVYDDDILFFLNLAAYFDGAGRESHFVREELLRLGRVALECFSHIPPTVEFQYGLQCRPSKKFAARRLSAFRAAESAHEKDDKANQQNQAKPATADHGTTKIKPAAAEQEKQNNHE